MDTGIHMANQMDNLIQSGIDMNDEMDRLRAKCEEYRNMLEDVVNELNLSGGMIEEHGPLGTAPAILVRLVLARKDQEISMLKSGMKQI